MGSRWLGSLQTRRQVFIAFALIVSAFLINRARPRVETEQPSAALVRASGKCAECHVRQQYSVVHEYEMSVHAQKVVNCLDCQPYLRLCVIVLAAQAIVGLIGFALHAAAVWRLPGTLLERVTAGAPPMAPLLFPNLVVLGSIAVWQWGRAGGMAAAE